MATKPKPLIVYYNPKSETFRECLIHITKWNSPDGASLNIKSKRKGKIYQKEDINLISKTSIGIAPRYYKDGQIINYVNNKGQINHRNLEKILQMQKELLQGAEIIEVIKKEFKYHKRTITPDSGTLYCTLSVNLYKFNVASTTPNNINSINNA